MKQANKTIQTYSAKYVEESTETHLPPKEIVYFDIESTIKEMACRILADYIDQAKRNEQKFDQIKEENHKIIKRFNETDFILHKTLQRSGNISDLQQEMIEIKQQFSVLESKVQQHKVDINSDVQICKEKVKVIEDHAYQYDREINRFKQYTTEFIEKNLKLKRDIEDQIAQSKREILKEINEMNFKTLKLTQQSNMHQGVIDKHFEELKRHELILDVYKRNIKELYDSEAHLHEKKLDAEQYSHSFDIFKKEISLFRISLDDVALTLSQTDNYLDKYLPIKIQNFITETLTNILPRRHLVKLNDYIHHKYRILKEAIEKDTGRVQLNKIEANIPIIKKIELMLQRDINTLSMKNQSRMDNRTISNDSFFIEEPDETGKIRFKDQTESVKHNKQKEYNSSKFKSQPSNDYVQSIGINQEENKSISNISQKEKKDGSSDLGTVSNELISREQVKKRNFLIYYPQLSEEQHQDIINIRFDPKTNLVPIKDDQNESKGSCSGKEVNIIHGQIIRSTPSLPLTQENLVNLASKEKDLNHLENPNDLKEDGTSRKTRSPSSSFNKRRRSEFKVLQPISSFSKAPPESQTHSRKNLNMIKIEINEDQSDKNSIQPKRKISREHSRTLRQQQNAILLSNKKSEPIIEQYQDESDEQGSEDDFEKNKLSVSSSSTDKRLIRFQDLNDDLAEMILEASEVSKSLKSAALMGIQQIQDTEKKAMQNIERLNLDMINSVTKELAKLQIFSGNLQRDHEDEVKRRVRDKSDYDIELKILKEKIDSNRSKIINNQLHMQSVIEMVESLSEGLDVILKLGAQDEDDRRSIGLYGYKINEDKNNLPGFEKNIFTIDRQCLGCSGQTSIIMNAFKIACLSYQPQSIHFKGQQMTREEIFKQYEASIKNARLKFETTRKDFLNQPSAIYGIKTRETMNTLRRSNTNQSLHTISSLADDQGIVMNPIDKYTNINIKNVQINTNMVSIDPNKNRCQTTSRTGSRNINTGLTLSQYQSYQKNENSLKQSEKRVTINMRPMTMNDQRNTQSLFSNGTIGISQRSQNSNSTSTGNQQYLQPKDRASEKHKQSSKLLHEIVKGKTFGNIIKAQSQTPREPNMQQHEQYTTFHVTIPQTARNQLIKYEDGEERFNEPSQFKIKKPILKKIT